VQVTSAYKNVFHLCLLKKDVFFSLCLSVFAPKIILLFCSSIFGEEGRSEPGGKFNFYPPTIDG